MSDPFGKRTLVIDGVEMTFHNIQDLEADIEDRFQKLREKGDEDPATWEPDALVRIATTAKRTQLLVEAHDTWAAEISAAHPAQVNALRDALRNLKHPFQD